MVGSDRINQLKMLGLVLMWASFALAIFMPAIGISELRYHSTWLEGTNATNPPDAKSVQNVPVWIICVACGCVGMLLWLSVPAKTSKSKIRRRKR